MNESLKKRESKELPTATLAYLGPNGNFTHMAGLEYARTRENTLLVPAKSLPEIFEMVDKNSVNYAIVPIDNSSDGHIKDTLEALQKMDMQIVGELVVPVSLSFVMRKDARPQEIWSKDTALRQARRYLDKHHPSLKRIPHKSTGDAILEASKNPNIAAIGSRISAKEQGIPEDSLIQKDGIEDNPANATRFVIITKNKELKPITEDSKTSFIMNVPDLPGNLFLCLDILKERGINLSQLKSFSRKDGNVLFIVTVSGHQYEENLSQALRELKKHASLKMLGSYKKAYYRPPEMDGQPSITEDDILKLKDDLFAEEPPKTNETIVAFSLQDKIGALRDVLRIFYEQKLNLMRIGSSPSTRGKLDEYIFYLSFCNNLPQQQKIKIMDVLKFNSSQLVLIHASERE